MPPVPDVCSCLLLSLLCIKCSLCSAKKAIPSFNFLTVVCQQFSLSTEKCSISSVYTSSVDLFPVLLQRDHFLCSFSIGIIYTFAVISLSNCQSSSDFLSFRLISYEILLAVYLRLFKTECQWCLQSEWIFWVWDSTEFQRKLLFWEQIDMPWKPEDTQHSFHFLQSKYKVCGNSFCLYVNSSRASLLKNGSNKRVFISNPVHPIDSTVPWGSYKSDFSSKSWKWSVEDYQHVAG